jgi:4-amino-4-deoxy-L-arabinose transferase-like glycosyltransferase
MTTQPALRMGASTPGRVQFVAVAIFLLLALRALASALLPLAADEAYYWLWSRHLAAGYLDHPPAIAFLIRAGTVVFGPTPLGLRMGSLVLSLVSTGFVWRAAAMILTSEDDGAIAALYFNLTLMVAVETLAATPDAPEIACAAALLYSLAHLRASDDGRWWLGVGAAGGFALLSKYTALFLGLGVGLWLVVSPWLYAGAAVAILVFSPNLEWNAKHGWMTFAFQFGRVQSGHLTLRYLGEFVIAQIGMATPFIFALAAMGLGLARGDRRLRLIAILVAPSLVYFPIHALHDRVQANWTSFLFPAFAVAAAAAAGSKAWTGMAFRIAALSARLAVPVGALILALCYLQALGGILPVGRADPISRLLGFGMRDAAVAVEKACVQSRAESLVTTDYATAGWLRFYLPSSRPLLALDDQHRWTMAPTASPDMLAKPMLYIAEERRDRHGQLAAQFTNIVRLGETERRRGTVELDRYVLYRVEGLRPVHSDFALP